MTGQAGTHTTTGRAAAPTVAQEGGKMKDKRELVLTMDDYISAGVVLLIRTDRACVRYHTNSATLTIMYRTESELKAGLEIAARILECEGV